MTVCGMEIDHNSRPIVSGIVHSGARPAISIDYIGNQATWRQIIELTGVNLAMARLRARRCIGYYQLSDFAEFPCPRSARLELEDLNQCPDCKRRSGFNPAFYNVPRSELSEAQREYNLSEHVVYLASFGESLVKIGISHRDRVTVRLREQGAILSCVIARADNAYEARAIERSGSMVLGLKEAVSGRDKLHALRQGLNMGSTMDTMSHYLDRVRRYINQPISVSDYTSYYMQPGYHIEQLKLCADADLMKPLVISGLCIGVVGDRIVLMSHEGGGVYTVSGRVLRSHRFTVPSIAPALPPQRFQGKLL